MIFKYKDYTTEDLSHLLFAGDMYPATLQIHFNGHKDYGLIEFKEYVFNNDQLKAINQFMNKFLSQRIHNEKIHN